MRLCVHIYVKMYMCTACICKFLFAYVCMFMCVVCLHTYMNLCAHLFICQHICFCVFVSAYVCFPGGASGKESAFQRKRHKRHGFDLWVRKIPSRSVWQPTPVFLAGESHGQRSLMGYCPQAHKESDTTEATCTHARTCAYVWRYMHKYINVWFYSPAKMQLRKNLAKNKFDVLVMCTHFLQKMIVGPATS